jgi:phosphoglycerate dehydrogenase-like enzyme
MLRLGVADECGTDFRLALTERLRDDAVTVVDLDGSPLDAAVVGGRDATTDIRAALDGGARWLQSLTAGVDRIRPHLEGTDVVLTNGAAATARPVSEFAMARLLEHAKQLPLLAERQAARQWDTRWLGALAGSVLTVVGLGPIGARVARLANAFEMHVVGVRRSPSPHPWCDEVVGGGELAAALSRSDYCVLAPALTDETRGMISAAVLDTAKPGLHLVNVGRGELVDHDALVAAASAGRVTAALDVLPEEPLPPEHPLWATPGIAVSSHTATLTPRLIDWLADLVAGNARRFAAGEPLEGVVDRVLGYPAR